MKIMPILVVALSIVGCATNKQIVTEYKIPSSIETLAGFCVNKNPGVVKVNLIKDPKTKEDHLNNYNQLFKLLKSMNVEREFWSECYLDLSKAILTYDKIGEEK